MHTARINALRVEIDADELERLTDIAIAEEQLAKARARIAKAQRTGAKRRHDAKRHARGNS